jgi:hypothetical protein
VIVVLVYRPEAADSIPSEPLDGVEVLGVYPDSAEDCITELVSELSEWHPKWQFHISLGHVEMHPVEQRELGVFS